MARRNPKAGGSPVYRTKPLRPHRDDSYRSTSKLAENSVCPACGAVFRGGRWQWSDAPESDHRAMCPACRRIEDDMPAGHVRLDGEFAAAHRDEIVATARNLEKKEKASHPLQRIMKIVEEPDAIVITTTDSHLARAIGEAVRSAYQGELEIHYGPDENVARVHWRR